MNRVDFRRQTPLSVGPWGEAVREAVMPPSAFSSQNSATWPCTPPATSLGAVLCDNQAFSKRPAKGHRIAFLLSFVIEVAFKVPVQSYVLEHFIRIFSSDFQSHERERLGSMFNIQFFLAVSATFYVHGDSAVVAVTVFLHAALGVCGNSPFF